MRSFLKNNYIWIALVVSILLIAGVFLAVVTSANKGTYELRNEKGIVSAMDGLDISFELKNDTHSQNISITNGILAHEFFGAKIPSDRRTDTIRSINAYVNIDLTGDIAREEAEPPDRDTEMWMERSNTAKLSFDVNVYNAQSIIGDSYLGMAELLSDITIVSQGGFEKCNLVYTDGKPGYYYMNPEDEDTEAIQELMADSAIAVYDEDEQIFIMPKLHGVETGMCALYKIEELDKNKYPSKSYRDSNEQIGHSVKLHEFPSEGIITYNFFAVSDKLCMLYNQEGMVRMRIYSKTGEVLADSALIDRRDNTCVGYTIKTDDAKETVSCVFDAGYPEDTVVYDFRFGKKVTIGEIDNQNSFAVSVADGIKLLSEVKFEDSYTQAAFAGGRWVVYKSIDMSEKIQIQAKSQSGAYFEDWLYVYDVNGKELYSAQIMTDRMDDLKANFYITGNLQYATFPRHLFLRNVTEVQ